MKWFSLTISCLTVIAVHAQKNEAIDSLKAVIATTESDSVRIGAYYEWDYLIYIEDPELDLEINEIIISIAERNLQNKNLSPSLRTYYTACVSRSKNVLGLVLTEYGNYKKAADLFRESLELAEQLQDTTAMSGPTNNLGMVLKHQGFTEEALKQYERAMELDGHTNPSSKAIYLNNIGLCYAELDKLELALDMYRESVALSAQVGDKVNQSNATGNIGEVYYAKAEYDSALFYFDKAMLTNQEINNTAGIVHLLERMGMVYIRLDEPQKALQYCQAGLDSLKNFQSLKSEMDCHKCLYFAYKELNNPAQALYHTEKFSEINDSLIDKEHIKAIERAHYELEYEKQKLADSLEVVNQAKIKQIELEADLKKKEAQQYLLYGGIVVLLVVGGLILRGYRRKQKDNLIITSQKMEVEEKNREIMDSIIYARRIQTAILPPDEMVEHLLPNSFIYYKPKDIVAGDFFWLEKVDNRIFLAIADCTGHGVPGAMVSVVCHNALNRSVREFKLKSPGEILNKTRELVVETFARSKENVKDGMDVCLLCWNSGEKSVQYAGANNPVYIIRHSKGNGNAIIEEIKADKQPIGISDKISDFNTREFILNEGDVIYAFTDGFADQFGGPGGKKYKYKQLKDKCLQLFQLSMDLQHQQFQSEFENWKGQLEQVDDVCIVGLSLN